jgi:hypothetical protein
MIGARAKLRFLWGVLGIACALMSTAGRSAEMVTLLVPGIVNPLGDGENQGDSLSTWKPLVVSLGRRGLAFGGVIRIQDAGLQLPRDLVRDIKQVSVESNPRAADLFVLEFSAPASVDGLGFRSLELAETLRVLKKFTGRQICIVAHSAGGLAARVVLQEACPGVSDARSTVARLVTIGTPHLGAALASNFGDLVGTRATSLKPNAGLIKRLNALPLPDSIQFTSIVVRSFGSDVRSPGEAYSNLVDPVLLQTLPWHFQRGGDEVVHVRSQNLRLAPTSIQFEKSGEAAVHTILVRVQPESAATHGPLATVHATALASEEIHEWVGWLLQNNGGFWTQRDRPDQKYVDWQIRQTIIGLVERRVLGERILREVTNVDIKLIQRAAPRDGGSKPTYQFKATASWKELIGGATNVEGWLAVELDAFGRISSYKHEFTN